MNDNPINNNTTNNTINNSGTFNSPVVFGNGNVTAGQINLTSGPPQTGPQEKTDTSHQADRSAETGSKTHLFDVCIVCALSEEARAAFNEFATRNAGIQFKRAFSSITGYEYQHATMNNFEGEQLKVLIMCMPYTGPIETVNSVRSLIDEFHPRFVAMTGICAGYREKVALGDLVAAAYAFHYEEGKVVAGESGQDSLRPEWRTHGTARRVVQYINSFESWKAPVTEMKQRMLGRVLRQEELPQCLVAPIASGMAVQGNNAFPRLLEHNRKALFLDQEVAAFYQTLSEMPNLYFLAVKGVCDHGDQYKNDAYHEFAARASAIYMLHFIHDYVTSVTMP